jgi:hypothetical protein
MTSTKSIIPPGRVARVLTDHLWGTAQTCRTIAPGIYRVDTASHGGYLALLDQCDLPGDFVDACEEAGLVEMLGIVCARRCAFASTAQGHSRESIAAWLKSNAARGIYGQRRDIFVAEEDCDWAALALVCREVARVPADGWTEARTLEYARDIISRYDHLSPFRYLLPAPLAVVA